MAVDFHIHSSFSGDSMAPMENMIQEGIRKGLSAMCFTEHMDMDFPESPNPFVVDTANYRDEFLTLRQKYQSQIDLHFGIELGLQPHLAKSHKEYLSSWPFDFVIGSSHVVHGEDPYYPAFYQGRNEALCYREYFESIPENLKAFEDIDVYGHIDYVVRYGPTKNQNYSYQAYRDILDEILRILVDKHIGLEINTGGFKYGLGHPNPTEDILVRYRELGGEIITIGSDAHEPQHLAYSFSLIPDLLKACGFRYYTVFKERKPFFYSLDQF